MRNKTTHRPTFVQRTDHLITLENARAWAATDEQWCFVTDLITSADIGYDPHGGNIERYVASIEHRFQRLLSAQP